MDDITATEALEAMAAADVQVREARKALDGELAEISAAIAALQARALKATRAYNKAVKNATRRIERTIERADDTLAVLEDAGADAADITVLEAAREKLDDWTLEDRDATFEPNRVERGESRVDMIGTTWLPE